MRSILAVFVLFAGLASSASAQTPVDTCGQRVANDEVGVLTGDLVCPAATTAITLGDGTLDLNGYSIEAPDGWGVWCEAGSKCIVHGGGEGGAAGAIRNAQAGIYLQRHTRLEADGVAIENCAAGIEAENWSSGRRGSKALLTDVSVTGSEDVAVIVGNLTATNVVIEDNPGDGILGATMGILRAEGLTVSGNATSAGCDVYGCSGIDVGKVKGRSLIVTGNAGVGIHALNVTLRDSTVTGNVRAGAGRDLVVAEAPMVRNVECNFSAGWGSQSSVDWGVCAFDDQP